jgi:ABC-type transporter Mla subunit MlaD
LHTDPKLQQPQTLTELRSLLYDFTDIIDELDDNLDAFDDRSADLRAALRTVIETETDFQQRLRKIRETFPPAVLQQVKEELEDAIEAVDDSVNSSRALLDKQNERKGQEKAEKKAR